MVRWMQTSMKHIIMYTHNQKTMVWLAMIFNTLWAITPAAHCAVFQWIITLQHRVMSSVMSPSQTAAGFNVPHNFVLIYVQNDVRSLRHCLLFDYKLPSPDPTVLCHVHLTGRTLCRYENSHIFSVMGHVWCIMNYANGNGVHFTVIKTCWEPIPVSDGLSM